MIQRVNRDQPAHDDIQTESSQPIAGASASDVLWGPLPRDKPSTPAQPAILYEVATLYFFLFYLLILIFLIFTTKSF